MSQLYVIVSTTIVPDCKLGIDLSWGGGADRTWSTESAIGLNGTPSTYIYGGATNTWGSSHIWTTDDLSKTNFVARVHAIAPDANCTASDIVRLDWLRVKAYYTASTDPSEGSLYAADAAKLAGVNIFTIHYGNTTGRSLLAQLASGTTTNSPHQPGSFYDSTNGSTGTVRKRRRVDRHVYQLAEQVGEQHQWLLGG